MRVIQPVAHYEDMQPTYADPSFVGLLGFIFATTMANLGNAGVIGTHSAIWVGVVFGGVVQFIAGLLHFKTGDTVSMTIFCAFGSYWMITPAFSLGKATGFLPITPAESAAWHFLWATLALFFMVLALWENKTLVLTLALVSSGLAMLGLGDATSNQSIFHLGGWLLIGASVVACWLLASGLLTIVSGRHFSRGKAFLKPL